MSLVVVWCNEEEEPRIWVATDTRISSRFSVLLEEGGKLFSLPVICRKPEDLGFFTVPYFTQEVGVACVGGSLIYQQVYTCVIPILSNLNGLEGNVPSLEDIARAVARVTTRYVSSLGPKDPSAHRVKLVLIGYCAVHDRQEIHELGAVFEGRMFRCFDAQALPLDEPPFYGDRIEEARKALAAEREGVRHPIAWHRAPIHVLRRFIEDEQYETIGGDVQVGYVSGTNFVRLTTVTALVPGEPAAYMRLNNIDLDEIGSVGPCLIGLTGIAFT